MDLPRADGGTGLAEFEIPPGSGSFLEKRKQAGHRDNLERAYRENLERRLEALERRLASEPDNPEVLSAMGILALLENQWERASALFERARNFAPDDVPLAVNYAITLAHRGQLQPSLALLSDLSQKHPGTPTVWANLALVALQARRPSIVHSAVASLEKLWLENRHIAQDFHDEAMTAQGLAFLQENKPREALAALSAAARHAVNLHQNEAKVEEMGDGLSITRSAQSDDAGEMILEGKGADAELLANLALAEAGLGDLDKAASRLKAALRMEPGHPRILANLGVLAYRQGRLNAARRYLELAQEVEEAQGRHDPTTWNHLGVVMAGLGELDGALELFQRAGSGEHAEVEVYYNLGRAFIEFGKADTGVNYLREAFKIEPNNPDIHTVLGAAYLFSGKLNLYAEAFKHLKRAIQIDSHHKTAAVNLIVALMEIKNNDAAVGLSQQALKLFPAEAEPHFVAALLELEKLKNTRQGETHWATASQQFDAAMNIRPELTSARYNSSLCQFMMGFRDTAATLLQDAVSRDPSIGPAYYLIGYGHAVAKRDNEAIAAWKIAAQYEIDNVDLHVNLAALLYRRGDFAGAIRSYMNAHRMAPGDASILAAVGVAFAQQKMFAQAINAIEHSISLDPRAPLAHLNLGLAYYLFNKVESAMEHWRIVSQLDSRLADLMEDDPTKRQFDDSVVQMRPISWENRVIRVAPVLPRPRTRFVPNTDLRDYHPVISDPSLQPIIEAKRQVERETRLLAWMSLK